MRVFAHQRFEGYYDRDSSASFGYLEFRNCYFQSCAISITRRPELRSTIYQVKLVNCEVNACTLWPGVVEDVLVDGLKTHGLLQTWAAVFRHVVLKGKIGRIMISSVCCPTATVPYPPENPAFAEANAEFYASVDWALDISQAEFKECDIRGVPADLIRRDPETQVIVRRQKALLGQWRTLDLGKTHWPIAIDWMLAREDPDIVLVAPKRAGNFRELLRGLELLREGGVAEAD